MMYHLFQNSIWKMIRIAKTSDCKISWRVFLQGTVHWVQKRSDRSRFFKANFDGFGQFSQKVLRIQKCYIPHWKALISSIQNLYRKGVWPLQQSSYAHLIENDRVLLKGAWLICGKGHALCR